ncbi:flagellar basal-body rod protein FlgF [Candidatus Liberibacter americanus]|uniref:Flagellar basal-body rod protein FlgF n=1 Tax=Candidatus Liberibacter americanus str. Sao Paulo TaxID=1261131 RepID=U6B6Z0_9HYPH|nr:flagellar basal-body rod protein FlgF [Candidatus Liberibacter americanus]AHA27636.1 Flagellar basal-body rod protein FlgF [Candidatus Liberibacter americanus str. Sao Paulo]EMS36345.1 flagellar basal body rod protein FlgF [Candidatus Liberibacter americanus PW_SP]
MQSSFNIGLSAQIALEKRLATVADNMSNANTTGFRTIKVKFSEVINSIKNDLNQKVSFVAKGNEYLSNKNGSIVNTGGDMDFALEGDAWFALETPSGMILTRDGRFKIRDDGTLISSSGKYPVLDNSGSSIQISKKDDYFDVGEDGEVSQNGKMAGVIGFYSVDLSKGFIRRENSGISPNIQPQPIFDNDNITLKRGYLEDSNANSMYEMSQLIHLTQQFNSITTLIDEGENSLLEAIKNMT